MKMDENGFIKSPFLKTIINFIPITIPKGKDDIQNLKIPLSVVCLIGSTEVGLALGLAWYAKPIKIT